MAARAPQVETLNYRPGGFHPVHLGDVFKKNRYTVIHKLGHGGFATVWLARDVVRSRYVALKILAARLSKDCPEVEILRRLRNSDEHPGKAYVMSLLDHFYIEGPNGSHLCVVSGVGGPSIKQFNDCPGLKSGSRRLRGEVARKVARQATEGLAFIHASGVVHGDFTAANLLLQLANIDEWTIDEIHERLGFPQTQNLHQTTANADDFSGPRYTVNNISMKQVDPKWLSDQIMIIDFGIAFLQVLSSPDFGTPKSYCAPEFYFGSPRSIQSDIWALGCAIFEIRTGSCLFPYRGTPTRDEILMAMVEVLGNFPVAWWNAWKRGEEWYSNETKDGGELSKIIQGTLREDIMEIGLHDGDAAIRPLNKTNAVFRLAPAGGSTPSDHGSLNHTTNRLVALVEELTTSEAADVLAQVNKSSSGSSQEKSTSGSGSGSSVSKKNESGSGTGSGSSKKNESGSGTGSSNTKSGDKSISSEGLSTGRPIPVTALDAGRVSEQKLLHDEDELVPTTVVDFLEAAGTLISGVEGEGLENLLRGALRFLPEQRLPPTELGKHHWFTDEYVTGVIGVP